MYKKHKSFDTPEDDKKIWRYMDFTKYLSLLDTKSLYFARSDTLGDPFEGSYPLQNVKQRKEDFKKSLEEIPVSQRRGLNYRTFDYEGFNKQIRYLMYINCWHMNQYESAAMWKLYLKSNEGIAIQTTVRRLKDCFLPNTNEVYIGNIHYRDYSTEDIPEGSFFTPFLYKRRSYEHEKELRAIFFGFPNSAIGTSELKDNTPPGTNISVNPQTLIECVYIAPESPTWFVELVDSVTKKYELDIPVIQSTLDAKPLY